MKPPAFAYHRPQTVVEAVALLAELGDDAKVIAGGQSLVPMLNMRLAQPTALVDVNFVADFPGLSVGDDAVEVGALVRQADVERSAEVLRALPILPNALRYVGHPSIRNRGTVVGSIAHADPCSELATTLLLLGGSLRAVGPRGTRDIPAEELFLGPFETALEPDEIALSARFPLPAPSAATAFVELARRHGDFALCAVAALVDGGAARVCVAGLEGAPRLLDISGPLERPGQAIEAAVAGLSARSDVHGSGEYRRRLARVLIGRALVSAGVAA